MTCIPASTYCLGVRPGTSDDSTIIRLDGKASLCPSTRLPRAASVPGPGVTTRNGPAPREGACILSSWPSSCSLCLRCHSPRGCLLSSEHQGPQGRASPLAPGTDKPLLTRAFGELQPRRQDGSGLEGAQLGGWEGGGRMGGTAGAKAPSSPLTFKAGVGVRTLHLVGDNKDLRSDMVGGWQPWE